MPARDVIVVGASAGGVEALVSLVTGLPADLPAALLVVVHQPANGPSRLGRILARAGPLPAAEAVDREPLRRGRVYVAGSDHHLLVERDRVRVLPGPHEHGLRPAVDPLFRSAAHAYGPRVAGVVLSGTLDDGAAGLLAVKRGGGSAIVQRPTDALFPGMPENALDALATPVTPASPQGTLVDHCVPVAEMPGILAHLAAGPVPVAGELEPAHNGKGDATDMTAWTAGAGGADRAVDGARAAKRENAASGLSCPECHGSLWEEEDAGQVRFECRVGHRYSVQSALAEQARTVEASIWAAINVLEERAALLHKQARRATERGHGAVAGRMDEQGREAQGYAETIRTSLFDLVRTLGADSAAGRSETG